MMIQILRSGNRLKQEVVASESTDWVRSKTQIFRLLGLEKMEAYSELCRLFDTTTD